MQLRPAIKQTKSRQDGVRLPHVNALGLTLYLYFEQKSFGDSIEMALRPAAVKLT